MKSHLADEELVDIPRVAYFFTGSIKMMKLQKQSKSSVLKSSIRTEVLAWSNYWEAIYLDGSRIQLL